MEVNVVYNKSCRNMSEVDDSSVGLVVTSPPYFSAKEYAENLEYSFKPEDYKKYLDFLKDVFSECKRVLKKGRFCIINTSNIIIMTSKYRVDNVRLPIAFDTHNIMHELGYEFMDDIIWKKPESSVVNRQANFFQTRKPLSYRPNQVIEYILVYRKKDKGQRTADFFKDIDEETLRNSKVLGDYETSNVWEFPPTRNSKHPAPFPYLLPQKAIQYYSFVGDVILDPFFGSGTTGYVAKDLKRDYIGYEISKEYIEFSKDRLTNMFMGF
ncbi:MAG: DNA-methyltransferase [bacterium]